MPKLFRVFSLLSLWLAACQPGLEPAATALPTVWATASIQPLATRQPPTATLLPQPPTALVTGTPLPPATSIPESPLAHSPAGNVVECYSGPAKEYQPGVTDEFTSSAEIVGIHEASGWWYVRVHEKSGSEKHCWVDQQSVTTSGDISKILVVEAAPAQVTAVNIFLDNGEATREINCANPYDQPTFRFRGEIVADGPVPRLKYQWETDAGPKFPPQTGLVRAWDAPQAFELELTVPARAGTYFLSLRTILPNEVVGLLQFVVKCK